MTSNETKIHHYSTATQGVTTKMNYKTGKISTGLSPKRLQMLQNDPARFNHFLIDLANSMARYFGVAEDGERINTARLPTLTIESNPNDYH